MIARRRICDPETGTRAPRRRLHGSQSRDAGRQVGVIHLEGNSLIQARLKAAVDGSDGTAPFAEGREARRPTWWC